MNPKNPLYRTLTISFYFCFRSEYPLVHLFVPRRHRGYRKVRCDPGTGSRAQIAAPGRVSCA
jgi:hypothetical protein